MQTEKWVNANITITIPMTLDPADPKASALRRKEAS